MIPLKDDAFNQGIPFNIFLLKYVTGLIHFGAFYCTDFKIHGL